MTAFTNTELMVIGVFALLLAIFAYRIIRGMPTMTGDISALRKRTLVWTQVSLVLTVLQLNYKTGDRQFAIILGLIVLFTGSVWLAARHYDRLRPADPETVEDDEEQ